MGTAPGNRPPSQAMSQSMMPPNDTAAQGGGSWLERSIGFFLSHRMITVLLLGLLCGWGLLSVPFEWRLGGIARKPVPVDALPNTGENQQIVFTEWPGRSPQDVEDQITYPLTTALLGVAGVRSIRSFSMFGFSTIYAIFDESVDFYWSRSRILEKLTSLPNDRLPRDAQPQIGPDATALGQVFWYTLEGRDERNEPAGGWDPQELRSVQQWQVRYSLMSVPGVSEVASIGGFVQEYQVDIDPGRMRAYDVSLEEVLGAIREANLDVGAQSIEVNRVEYLIRGIGFLKGVEDLQNAVIKQNGDVPIFIRTVADVSLGPAPRQGALDKAGMEAVGGVVVVRFGANPFEVIQAVREKISEIGRGLPQKTLPDGRTSRVTVVSFYDRTHLIRETLATLETALANQIWITILVVIVMTRYLASSLLLAGILPMAVLFAFIGMKLMKVEANIVSLAGIAIAIGAIVDMGIIVTENIFYHLGRSVPGQNRTEVIFRAVREVSGAVLTAISTTIISFFPVFLLDGAAGRLFKPLAYTKTFVLMASLVIALWFIPSLVDLAVSRRPGGRLRRRVIDEAMVFLGGLVAVVSDWRVGVPIAAFGLHRLAAPRIPERFKPAWERVVNWLVAASVTLILAFHWRPLGQIQSLPSNIFFVIATTAVILGGYRLLHAYYVRILGWCLAHKTVFLCFPASLFFFGVLVWQGYDRLFGWMPRLIDQSAVARAFSGVFPGLSEEFMPPLDEGAYLMMPITMPHASIGEVLDILQKQDRAISALAEVETVVGKLGRAESALDPAPLSMIETLVNCRSEYLKNPDGELLRFRFDPGATDFFHTPDGRLVNAPDGAPYHVRGRFIRDERNRLIPDSNGRPFRLWREPLDASLNPGRDPWRGIRRFDDIWEQVVSVARIPGVTSAARLQPISARQVMLQTGIRAAMGIKVYGPDQETIQKSCLDIERYLRQVHEIDPGTVIADRIIGKPYLEIRVDRNAIAQYGIRLQQVLDVIEFAIGGRQVTTTVENRQRYAVRVRYHREERDHIESLGRILVAAANGVQVPLQQLAEIVYEVGPEVIKSENTFLVGYVLFGAKSGYSEVTVVESAKAYLQEMIDIGEFRLPGGVSYAFTGSYENQVRLERQLRVVVPVAIGIIFVLLLLQFGSVRTTTFVFSGIGVAWAGGFTMLWLYGQPWFMDFSIFGVPMRELFQVRPIHLSLAVWVGFLALFGLACDDGVLMATYLENRFEGGSFHTVEAIRAQTIEGSLRRVRPCLMIAATSVLALLPVLTSGARGADIMLPMAVPLFGGMAAQSLTMLVVPVLYCLQKERELHSATQTLP